MADLIYRQEAIDALGEREELSDTWTDEYEVGRFQQWRDDVEVLKKLPSAQSEQCEYCKNRGLEDGDTLYISADWDGGIGFDYIRDIHYCPKCGRRL